MPYSDLVGREIELARIEAQLDPTENGGAYLAVRGPAGIGKTALAEAVALHAEDRGFGTTWALCAGGPGAPDLWPWIQIVREVCGIEIPDAPTPFARRDAVVRLLHERAQEMPLLLVIDDLHEADAASLEVLDLLVRQRRRHPVSVLVTLRFDEHPLLDRVLRGADRIELGGLDVPGVGRLVRRVRPPVTDETARRLHETTGGNPFFVLELARQLGERSSRHPDDLRPPPSVHHVVVEHLATVDDVARQVLAAAAVQGQHFSRVVLQRSLPELDSLTIDRALTQAAAVDLLDGEPPHESFRHMLIVDALVSQLPDQDRRHLHRAIADASHEPEVVAAHLARAGDLTELDELVRACRSASAAAEKRYAFSEGARHLYVAVEAARASDDPDLEIDLLLAHAAAASRDRDLVVATASSLEAARLARQAGDDRRLVLAALAMPPDVESLEVDQLTDEAQIALREEALVRLPRDDDGLGARLMAALAMSLYWAQRTGDRALDHRATSVRRDQLTRTAMTLTRTDPSLHTRFHCIDARLSALWGPDAPVERDALVDDLTALATEAGDGELLLRALGWRVVLALSAGDQARATAVVAEHRRVADLRHDPVARWTSTRWQASLAALEGRLEESERLALDALELGRTSVGEDAATAFYAVQIGLLHFFRGTLGDLFETVRGMAEDAGHVPAWRCGLVWTAVEAGELDLAARELRSLAVDDFAVLPRDLDWLSSLVILAPAAYAVADDATATTLRQLLEPYADQHALVGLGYASYGPVRRALAYLDRTLGDQDSAIEHLRQALGALDPAHVTYAAILRTELAEALVHRGSPDDLDRACTLLRSTGPTLDELGLATTARQAEALRAELSGRRAAVLRRDQGGWIVAAPGGVEHRLRDLRGLSLLQELLGRSDDLTPLELLWAVEPVDDPPSADGLRWAVSTEHGGPVIDATARGAYEKRIAELDERLERADRRGDAEASAAATVELERLRDELARATGLHRRTRTDPDATERARTSATKLLRRAIGAIGEVEPALGAHLDAAIRTGSTCAYRPPDSERIEWDLG